jgi:hypothetical protein
MDHSALKAIYDLAEQYDKIGSTLYLGGLSRSSIEMLSKVHDGRDGKRPKYKVIVGSLRGSDDNGAPINGRDRVGRQDFAML